MILSCVMILVFLLLLIILAIKSRTFYPIIIKMFGIILMAFSLILYAAKMSIYHTNIPMEYDIYLFLNRIKIAFDTVFLVSNIGLICFLVSQVMYIRKLCSMKKRLITCSIIPIIVFGFLNSKTVCEKIYLRVAEGTEGITALNEVNSIVNIIMLIIFISFMIIPYVVGIYSYFKTKLFHTKTEIVSSCTAWLGIDVLGAFLIYGNRLDMAMFYNMSLLKYPKNIYITSSNLSILIFIIFLLAIVYFVMKKFSPFADNLNKRNIEVLVEKDENTIMMLHSYKNAFCSILMCSDMNNNVGNDETRIDIIREIAEDFSKKIEKTIQMYRANEKTLFGVRTQIDLVETVNTAIKKSKIDFPVDLKTNSSSIEITADAFQINECLICILNNAYEAIDYDKEDKKIIIEIGVENSYVYINITDNGCGVNKKTRQKMFKPLYSTKLGGNNFGMGLAYARKIAKSHGGNIKIKSKEEAYTTVQIVLNKSGK